MITGSEPWIGNAVTGLSTLIAAYIGFFASWTQSRTQKRDSRIKREEELTERKFAIYNNALKAHGIHDISTVEIDSELFERINVQTYRQKIRTVLYDGLHIIDRDVREKLQELDYKVAEIDFMNKIGDWPDKENGQALDLYWELIKLIESHYTR